MLFELSAQILSRLTIALRARSPEAILPDVIASVSEAIQEKDRATECAMTDFCAFYQPHVIAEGASLSAINGLLRRKLLAMTRNICSATIYRKFELAMAETVIQRAQPEESR